MEKSAASEVALEGKKGFPQSQGSGVLRSCSWEGRYGSQGNRLQPVPDTAAARAYSQSVTIEHLITGQFLLSGAEPKIRVAEARVCLGLLRAKVCRAGHVPTVPTPLTGKRR